MGTEVPPNRLFVSALKLEPPSQMLPEDPGHRPPQARREAARLHQRQVKPRDLAAPGDQHRLVAAQGAAQMGPKLPYPDRLHREFLHYAG